MKWPMSWPGPILTGLMMRHPSKPTRSLAWISPANNGCGASFGEIASHVLCEPMDFGTPFSMAELCWLMSRFGYRLTTAARCPTQSRPGPHLPASSEADIRNSRPSPSNPLAMDKAQTASHRERHSIGSPRRIGATHPDPQSQRTRIQTNQAGQTSRTYHQPPVTAVWVAGEPLSRWQTAATSSALPRPSEACRHRGCSHDRWPSGTAPESPPTFGSTSCSPHSQCGPYEHPGSPWFQHSQAGSNIPTNWWKGPMHFAVPTTGQDTSPICPSVPISHWQPPSLPPQSGLCGTRTKLMLTGLPSLKTQSKLSLPVFQPWPTVNVQGAHAELGIQRMPTFHWSFQCLTVSD